MRQGRHVMHACMHEWPLTSDTSVIGQLQMSEARSTSSSNASSSGVSRISSLSSPCRRLSCNHSNKVGKVLLEATIMQPLAAQQEILTQAVTWHNRT